MDLADAPEEARFREEVRAWLEENLPKLAWPEPHDLQERAPFWRSWQRLLHDAAPDDDRLVAAKAFLRYLTEQSAAWTAAGMIPARSAARETPDFAASPQAVLTPTIPTMRFLPTLPGVPDVQTFAQVNDVDQTFNGAFSAETPAPDRENPKCEAGEAPPWVGKSETVSFAK